jgi:hypothetical protein
MSRTSRLPVPRASGTSGTSRTATVLSLVGLLIGTVGMLGAVGVLRAAPAQATTYDQVVVTDALGDVGGARFPDLVRVRFSHDVLDNKDFFRAAFQLRKDVPWRGFRTAGFRANRYSVTTSALEERYRVHVRRPDGTTYVCRRCTVRVMPARRRIAFLLPWARIGSPSYVRMSASYVSAGYLMDTAEPPVRVLY